MAQTPSTINTTRRIPAEKAATHEELTAAIDGLTRHDLFKLRKAAGYRVRGLGRKAGGRDWQDLFNETVLAFFRPDGRRWKKEEVDILRTLAEAMRSVADSWKRSFDENEPHFETELITTFESGQKSNPFAEYADPMADVQADLEAAEYHAEIAEKISRIERILEQRERAALILMGMKDGLSGPELKKELEISQTELETEMIWIRRNVRATLKARS